MWSMVTVHGTCTCASDDNLYTTLPSQGPFLIHKSSKGLWLPYNSVVWPILVCFLHDHNPGTHQVADLQFLFSFSRFPWLSLVRHSRLPGVLSYPWVYVPFFPTVEVVHKRRSVSVMTYTSKEVWRRKDPKGITKEMDIRFWKWVFLKMVPIVYLSGGELPKDNGTPFFLRCRRGWSRRLDQGRIEVGVQDRSGSDSVDLRSEERLDLGSRDPKGNGSWRKE